MKATGNGARPEKKLDTGLANNADSGTVRVSTKKAKAQRVRIDDFIRIAAEKEGRRLARLGFEARGNKRSVLLTERMLWSYIALGFEAGARFGLASAGAPNPRTSQQRSFDRGGQAVKPTTVTVHSFPVKEVSPVEITLHRDNGRPGLRIRETRRACLYARMLTSGSCRTQLGLDEQLWELRNFATQHGWPVAAEFVQQHETGKYLRREKFHALLDAAENQRFDVLLFCSEENSRPGLPSIEQLPVTKLLEVGWRSNNLLRELPAFYRAVFG